MPIMQRTRRALLRVAHALHRTMSPSIPAERLRSSQLRNCVLLVSPPRLLHLSLPRAGLAFGQPFVACLLKMLMVIINTCPPLLRSTFPSRFHHVLIEVLPQLLLANIYSYFYPSPSSPWQRHCFPRDCDYHIAVVCHYLCHHSLRNEPIGIRCWRH
jgi:hypothetical protein